MLSEKILFQKSWPGMVNDHKKYVFFRATFPNWHLPKKASKWCHSSNFHFPGQRRVNFAWGKWGWQLQGDHLGDLHVLRRDCSLDVFVAANIVGWSLWQHCSYVFVAAKCHCLSCLKWKAHTMGTFGTKKEEKEPLIETMWYLTNTLFLNNTPHFTSH